MRHARYWRSALVATAAIQLAAVFGCSSLQSDAQRWQGRPIADLIAARGEANRIMSYPYGGTLYIWEQRQTRMAGGSAEIARGGRRFEDMVMMQVFLVDERGVITRIQSKTVAVPSNGTN